MSTPTSTTTTTAPSSTLATPPPFIPLDFLPRFVASINGGVVFRTANGSSILSSIKEGDIISPAQVCGALDLIAGYFRSPGLSSDMNVDRTQQFAVFLAEIVKHQRHNEDSARFTAYELGNAVAALQAVLKSQTPIGNN